MLSHCYSFYSNSDKCCIHSRKNHVGTPPPPRAYTHRPSSCYAHNKQYTELDSEYLKQPSPYCEVQDGNHNPFLLDYHSCR